VSDPTADAPRKAIHCRRCFTERGIAIPSRCPHADDDERESFRRSRPTAVLIDGERLTVGQLEDLFVETHPIGETSVVRFDPPRHP